jgi:hypothetical protein
MSLSGILRRRLYMVDRHWPGQSFRVQRPRWR